MIKKKIIPLILAMTISLSVGFVGCGCSNGKTAGETVKDAAEDTKDEVAKLWDKVTDQKMDYSVEELKQDLDNKGYKLTETDKVKERNDFFKVKGKTYEINNGYLSLYEYDSDAAADLEADINTITDNGTKVNGTDVTWNTAAHIYKKGRVVAIYDGDNADVLTALKEVLGAPILG